MIPSPESTTVPVVKPVANKLKTAWLPMYNFGTLNSSNINSTRASLLALGFPGGSVNKNLFSSGSTGSPPLVNRSSNKSYRRSISVTIPYWTG